MLCFLTAPGVLTATKFSRILLFGVWSLSNWHYSISQLEYLILCLICNPKDQYFWGPEQKLGSDSPSSACSFALSRYAPWLSKAPWHLSTGAALSVLIFLLFWVNKEESTKQNVSRADYCFKLKPNDACIPGHRRTTASGFKFIQSFAANLIYN